MRQQLTFDEPAVARYFYWINERYAIYLRRKRGDAWPWTADKILQEYKFTNAFRELDTGTVWLRENWLEPYADSPTLYFNIAMYRQFNWPNTMQLTGYIHQNRWNPQRLTDVVEAHQFAGKGNKVFTGAYMIRGQCVNPSGIQWTSKSQYMFHQVLQPIWEAPEPDWQAMTLEEAHKWWMQFEGFGHFISYEIVTDMRHTRYLKDAADIMTWANPGPGAQRGLQRLWGIYKIARVSVPDCIQGMRNLLELSPDYLEDYVPDLEMRDIEHSLCEFDKYERVRLGQGRPRSKFVPPHKRK